MDQDIIHLGYNDDGSFVTELPALPQAAALTLKAELEEVADPLYIPTVEGIKGKMTVGDRTAEMANFLRRPYAPQTRLFDRRPSTQAFSRSYILSQSSKVPPRGTPITKDDFVVAKESTSNHCCIQSCLVDLMEDETTTDTTPSTDQNDQNENSPANGSQPTDNGIKRNNDNSLMTSIIRQSRTVTARTDRWLALFGHQPYATPSMYASQVDKQLGDDALNRQDEIAAHFFQIDEKEQALSELVRTSFLKFFMSILLRYKFYIDPQTNTLQVDRFIQSLRLSDNQQKYVRFVITSQMFDLFLHGDDTRSRNSRRWFDSYLKRGGKTTSVHHGTALLWLYPTFSFRHHHLLKVFWRATCILKTDAFLIV